MIEFKLNIIFINILLYTTCVSSKRKFQQHNYNSHSTSESESYSFERISAGADDFPYVVALTSDKTCCRSNFNNTDIGTLLNGRYVLARAWIASQNWVGEDKDDSGLKVFVLDNGKLSQKSYAIEKIILHSQNSWTSKWNFFSKTKKYINLSLVKLKECVKGIKMPVVLEEEADENFIPGAKVKVVGLGSRRRGDVGIETTDITLAARRSCAKSPTEQEFCIPRVHFDRADGPVMFYSQGGWKQVGLSSWTLKIPRTTSTTYFTRIPTVISWIKSIVDNDPDVEKCKEKEPTISSEETTTSTTTPEPDESDETPVEL